jgi:drug/metabolite transporter (DMT)-like permease
LLLAVVRMVVTSMVLTGVLVWRGRTLSALRGRSLAIVVLCAVLMVYANQLLFVQGLLRSTATNAALIMALSPLVSVLMAAAAFGETLTRFRVAGIVLGFAGVAAVVLSHPGARLSTAGLGDLLLVAGVVSFAAGGAMVQRLARSIDPLVISWAIYLIGALLLLLNATLDDTAVHVVDVFPGWWPWALVLFSAVLATGLSNLVWNGAIARIGVARTSVFFYLVPVFGVGFAALFLGEKLTGWHLAGFVAVMGGTYLGTRKHAPATASP